MHPWTKLFYKFVHNFHKKHHLYAQYQVIVGQQFAYMVFVKGATLWQINGWSCDVSLCCSAYYQLQQIRPVLWTLTIHAANTPV